MRLTTRTDLAMRALMYCAQTYPTLLRKADIATACDVNENHLAQVIHVLGLRGFLLTKRGRLGGVTLARPASQISVGAIFRSLEAEVPFAECFEKNGGDCPMQSVCGLKCLLARAVSAFYETLDEVTLDTLLRTDGAADCGSGASLGCASSCFSGKSILPKLKEVQCEPA